MMDSPSDTSQILADRLRMHRIESRKARRRTDFGPLRPADYAGADADLFVAEALASDHRASLQDPDRVPDGVTSQSGIDEPTSRLRQPGLRELDEKMQKLEKLNFDLKMEITYRRGRQEKLENTLVRMSAQFENAIKMAKEHHYLRQLNIKLTAELDKSNQAVDQAVQMICDLEAKNEELQQRAQTQLSRSQSTYYSDSGYAGSTIPMATVIPPTPPRKKTERDLDGSPVVAPSAAKRALQCNRVPSFMSNAGLENLALREAYSRSGKGLKEAQSFLSMISRASDGDGENQKDLPSPRLSVLSESSFPSIYEKKKKTVHSNDETTHVVAEVKPESDHYEHNHVHDSIKRVSKWMEQERNASTLNQPEFFSHEIERLGNSHQASGKGATQPLDYSSDEYRPSTTSTNQDASFLGWPDGGSIVTGTPSRFRITRGYTNPGHDYLAQTASDNDVLVPSTTRPSTIRASTSPNAHPAVPLAGADSDCRQDSFTSASGSPKPRNRTLEPVPAPAAKLGTRASLAAKTHRFFRLGGARDAQLGTMPPPKPDLGRRKTLGRSATAADVSLASAVEDSNQHGHMPFRTAKSRRQSIDPATMQARRKSIQPDSLAGVEDMSRNGAQAAWDTSREKGWKGRSLNSRVERRWA